MKMKRNASKELNWRIFLTILESLQYLARQELAVRDDDEDESNFIQRMRLQSKKFPYSKKIERYTTHDVQNEIVNLISNQIFKSLGACSQLYFFDYV